MTTVFTRDPIKVNLISVKNTIKQTIVFIGIVPTEVRKALEHLESTMSLKENKILNRFYGNNWASKLGFKRIKGGDEDGFSFDEGDVENSDSKISFTDLNDDVYIKNDESNIAQITDTDTNMKVRFIFSDPYLSVYPEDKILEFKKKIYTVLNIPIFRQHVWYVYQGRTIPVNYSIFNENSIMYINVQDMLNKYAAADQLIENIPVSTKYYQIKNNLKVMTDDTFSIVGDYYYNGITEYNLLDLAEFIDPSRNALINIITDRYQLELIYYSFILLYWPMMSIDAFSEYIKSENNVVKLYPDLNQNVQELKCMYKLEKKIIDTKYDLINNPKMIEPFKKIKKLITNSIVYSTIKVLKYQNNKDTVIFMRNLFDKFPLTDMIIGSKCNLLHDGKRILLSKTYKNNPHIRDEMELDSIMFKIKLASDTTKLMSLILYRNGNYVIKAGWREEDHYDFDDVFDIVKNTTTPIINEINKMSSVLNNKTIPIISKTNSKFTEICMSIFFNQTLTQDQFNILKSIMTDYRKAGIVRDRSVDESSMEYYFSKGMYQFQANRLERNMYVNNYYNFLTDGAVKHKWFTIFDKTRITKIFHRYSDVKIEIVGIKEDEFYYFYNLIITLFYIYGENIKSKPVHNESDIKNINDRKLKKTLKNLKEQDPVLYNFKKLYKTENIYSKICQKPYQPMLLNKTEYDQLAPDKKKNAVKYWNFTTNKDAYYACPNPKFPYIKFIVKRHPKDYCIPCCKKMQVLDAAKDAKHIIYNACMKDHKYTPDERTITTSSRYIMAYGKDVEPGRLSRLPDDSLEPLFYETYSIKSQGVDSECILSDGYYLYGIIQEINYVKNVGIINTLIHATDSTISEFIMNIIKLLKISPNKFSIILDGKINKYFSGLDTFITTLNTVFIQTDIMQNTEHPWNEIFISIAYLFLNINIVEFNHSSDINLILPNFISNRDQFLSKEFKHIIILKKNNKVFPIYLLNTDVFFKVKMFTKKIFEYDDSIIILISKLLDYHFNEKIKKNVVENVTLITIKKFTGDTKYKISKLFINTANACYYIHLKSNGDIYIPVESSHYIKSDLIDVNYDVFSRKKYPMTIETMIQFIKDFNHWIAVESEKEGLLNLSADIKLPLEARVYPLYPYIEINNWLVLESPAKDITPTSKVIGFVSNNLYYYIKDITLAQATKIKNVKSMQIFYDPDIINAQILNKTTAVRDDRSVKIGKSIYNSNLYQLFLLEFMTLFSKSKNIGIRQKLKKMLLGNINKDFELIMKDIGTMICNCDDYNKVKVIICEFVTNHHDKNILMREIDDTNFVFDRETFESIKKLPHDKLYKELEQLSKKIFEIGDVDKIKDFEFPNMFTSCQDKKGQYCKNNKLLISRTKLADLLDIMTSDILNPVKEKWLFSSLFNGNFISYFRFIKRLDENITITIE